MNSLFFTMRRNWVVVLSAIAVVAPFALANPQAMAQGTTEKVFERVLEDKETGTIVLQFPVRRFERKDPPGPVIMTHGMVHIADREFYEKHQALLDTVDVVLFEQVLPLGVGRPEYALQDTDTAEWRIATTQARMRTLAAVAQGYAMRNGKLPRDFDEILRWDGSLRAFADRLGADGWGNAFHFSISEGDAPDAEDPSEPNTGNGQGILEIASWGNDNAPGGKGENADLLFSQQESLSSAEIQRSDMHRMAESLVLAFQGDVMLHDRPHWRSSDLSTDQVGERLAAQGMPGEEKRNADAWMPHRMLETMATMAKSMPGLKNAGKVFFLDTLAESPIAAHESSSDAFTKVILEDRNQVVIDDLTAILQQEPGITSIGIIYGAAHMPDIESRLIDMGYQEASVKWIDAIRVSLPNEPEERTQLELSRKTIRSMGLLGGSDTTSDGKRKRWRRSNTSEEALAQNYRKEMMRDWAGALAKSLDADREMERDRAEKELMELGSAVIPYLPALSDDDSDEFRMRLERIRGTLLERDKEMLSKPSRVNLSGTMTGREALESLAQQTGNRLELKNVKGLDSQIDVEMEDLLYWESLDELLDKLQLTILPSDGDALTLVPRDYSLPQRFVMASYTGGFRLEPVAITKEQRFYEPALSTTSVELSLAWEPRLNPIFVRYELEGLEWRCDNGEVLRPKPDQGTDFTPTGSQMTAVIEFDRPSRSAKEISEWKGRFLCAIPGQAVAVRFKDLDTARNITLSKGDLEVTLERARKNRDVQEILIGISLRGTQTIDSLQGWTSLIDAYLEDPKGNRIDHAGWSTTRITDRGVGLSFLFEVEESLADHQLVFVAPQSIMQQALEYSLGGIPLP